MKTLLVAVNSKYIHTSLSVRTLCANSKGCEFTEFTINEDITYVAARIFEAAPDIVCFSCYIWNIEFVEKTASCVKLMLPDVKIILGGPEVSFCADEILRRNSFVDAVIRGEGELTLAELCESNFDFSGVCGVTYRGDEIIENKNREVIQDLDNLAFAYTHEDLSENSGKLIYYESSRGCPYRCSYCLSSVDKSLRYKSVDKVKSELSAIIAANPKTIKFTDRTFNSDSARAEEILSFLIENADGVMCHFEIEAHSLTESFLEIARRAPSGLFRFEIGLQSANPNVLREINRNVSLDDVFENIHKICENNNIHVHLDLIAGLPLEDYNSFGKSFDAAVALKPDVLQLGFLKLLKGTRLRGECEKHGYKYRSYPPYEVIQSNAISCGEMLRLKQIEKVFDMYYNSGAFKRSFSYLHLSGAFGIYERLSEWFSKKGLFSLSLSRTALYGITAQFAKSKSVDELFFDLLKIDYFESNRNAATPEWSLLPYNLEIHKKRLEIIDSELNGVFKALSHLGVREILKRVHFEEFLYRVHDDCTKGRCVLAFSKDGELLGEIIGY